MAYHSYHYHHSIPQRQYHDFALLSNCDHAFWVASNIHDHFSRDSVDVVQSQAIQDSNLAQGSHAEEIRLGREMFDQAEGWEVNLSDSGKVQQIKDKHF